MTKEKALPRMFYANFATRKTLLASPLLRTHIVTESEFRGKFIQILTSFDTTYAPQF